MLNNCSKQFQNGKNDYFLTLILVIYTQIGITDIVLRVIRIRQNCSEVFILLLYILQ